MKKIARLAALDIRPEQVADYEKNLSSILNLVEQMDAVDTTGVEPMAHPLHMVQPLRDDAVTEEDQRDHFQEHAPATEDGYYLVPKVIE
ncbi:glutamyl-tRNA(Gln) amidotransferase, C subunit [gamma proteobacterium HTCC5015]|nr:glutamyl-tRNA(Gln) amidotransferase, C subunit [gamma proteobacterium HTCC5015]